MKKYLLIISTVVVLGATLMVGMVSLSPAVQAVDITQGCTGRATTSAACKDARSVGTSNPLFGPHGVITTAVELLTIVIGIAAVIVLVLAGIRFMTANGDAGSVAKARSSIIYAAVGLAVTAFSQAIVSFVLSKLS